MKPDRKRLLNKRSSPERILLWLFISILLVFCESIEAKSQEKSLTAAVDLALQGKKCTGLVKTISYHSHKKIRRITI